MTNLKQSIFLFRYLLCQDIQGAKVSTARVAFSQQQFANVNTTLFFDTLMILLPGMPYLRGRLSTLDLLVVTSLDNLLLILKTLFTFLQNKLPY